MNDEQRHAVLPVRANVVFVEFFTTLWYLRLFLAFLLVLFVLLSAGMYYYGGPVETANRTPSPPGETLYFCTITALTIGYGDVVPTTVFGRIDAMGLGFIGLLMTGIVSAAAVRGVQEASRRAGTQG
jgi:voltage-gated potassium channel